MVIEANDLLRRFNDFEVLAGVSFQVERGEIFGLLGPNDAGKTTTIHPLTGRIDPTGGYAVWRAAMWLKTASA
jgi:ABC-2 type transport system ATP-binding protein